MKNNSAGIVSFICFLLATTVCFAQKPDTWPMQNAVIGPESPIELQAGGSYDVKVMYPVPDGPLFPLKASVVWSIAPAIKGISIDAQSGKITAKASVPHGATTVVYANVEHGKRKLQAKLYIYKSEENPLIGHWHVDAKLACGDQREMKLPPGRNPVNGAEWKFHVDRQFWIGREMSIAAGIVMNGSYEYNLKFRELKLAPSWPRNKPSSAWTFSLNDAGELLLHPLGPDGGIDPACSYVLHRR